MIRLTRTFILAIAAAAAVAQSAAADWTRSVVTLEVTRKQYDYFQPWTRQMKSTQKTGVITAPREILTTADELFDRTLIRVQSRGRGLWRVGQLLWIDYHANLAAITVEDDAFWDGLEPVELAGASELAAPFQVARWRERQLELRKAELSRFTVSTGQLSFVPHLSIELTCEISGAGWGEAVIAGGKLAGLLSAQAGTTCFALPSNLIAPILEGRRNGQARELGYFHFYWQPGENPDTLAHLGVPEGQEGVVIIDVPPHPDGESSLKAQDVILQIGEFKIDVQGDYIDPQFGPQSLEGLATRGRWAGEEVKIKILRSGEIIDTTYRLPRAQFSDALVPDAVYDQEPEYLLVGGLIFQPLTDAFLRGWGEDWKRRSPFRLFYYNNQDVTEKKPSLVILSGVLPDIYNLGYQDIKYLVVDTVNGRPIATLDQLADALDHPQDGYHRIEFVRSDSLRRLVLSASDRDDATQRILRRYQIPSDRHIISK